MGLMSMTSSGEGAELEDRGIGIGPGLGSWVGSLLVGGLLVGT